MKTKYVADDGTSFDTKKECLEYEERLTNKYVVLYTDKETYLTVRETFKDEPSAKRFISDLLHDCYKDKIISKFKLVRRERTREKTVEFDSNELARFVPAHYNIDGDKLDEIFRFNFWT